MHQWSGSQYRKGELVSGTHKEFRQTLRTVDCGTWIKVSGDAGVFEMRKPRQNVKEKRNRGGEDDDLVDPEVYFQCCISCDVDPEFLL